MKKRSRGPDAARLTPVGEDGVQPQRMPNFDKTSLASVVEQTSYGIFITNPQGAIEYVNPAYERLTGLAAGQTTGTHPPIVEISQLETPLYQHILSRLRTGGGWSGRYTIIGQRGDQVRVEAVHSPLRGTNRGDTLFMGCWRDISQEELMEEQLRFTQRMEAVGVLAGGVAHEFNNLLMPVIGFTELTLETTAPGSEEYEQLTIVRQSAHKAKALVEQMLVFGERNPGEYGPVNLRLQVEEALDLIRPATPPTVTIRTKMQPNLDMISGEPTRIRQVVINLCINAIQSMPPGGELEISVQNVVLDEQAAFVTQEKSGPHVRISVRDTGQGMSRETLSHIFDPFFSTRTVGKGSGLGLSTLYGTVKSLGGALNVKSRVGEGSTFEVFFPAFPGNEKSGGNGKQQAVSGSESILAVEEQ